MGRNSGDNDLLTYDISDPEWHHVVGITNTVSGKLYVDGVLVDSGDLSSGYTYDFCIGAQCNDGNSHNFDGQIDNIMVYDYARTPAQIAWDYNRGKPVGWWKMDEGEGGYAYDSSGNGNTGTVNNITGDDWIEGKFNQALDFDELGKIDLGNPSELNFQPNELFSLGGWISVEETFPLWHSDLGQWLNTTSTFVGRGSTSGSVGIGVYSYWEDTGDPDIEPKFDYAKFYIGSRAVDTIAYSSSAIEFNKYYHVFFVYTPGMQYAYINGELVDSRDNSAGLEGSFDETNWGVFAPRACPGGNGGNMAGITDDVRVYNYALTAEQVRQTMNEGMGIRFGD